MRSCCLQQAEGKRAGLVRGLLRFDHVVYQDAAANSVTVALRHDISDSSRGTDLELQRPRQGGFLEATGFAIAVEIADVGHAPGCSENLVSKVLGVERFGIVHSGVAIRKSFLRAEDAMQSRHGEASCNNNRKNDEDHPHPSHNSEDRIPPISSTLSVPNRRLRRGWGLSSTSPGSRSTASSSAS